MWHSGIGLQYGYGMMTTCTVKVNAVHVIGCNEFNILK